MWDFFVYVNTPIVLSSWLDAWLYDSWNENQKVMHWALGNDVNSALTLCLPDGMTYTRDVVLVLFQEYMVGSITMEAIAHNIESN